MIEKGRHRNPPLDRSERTCPFCESVIEDEIHFLIECPKYNNERIPIFRACNQSSIYFENMTNELKFIFIMSNEDINIMSILGSFIFNCLKKREIELIQ